MSIFDNVHTAQVPRFDGEYFKAGPEPTTGTGQEPPASAWPADQCRYVVQITGIRETKDRSGVPQVILEGTVISSEEPNAAGSTRSHCWNFAKYPEATLGQVIQTFINLLGNAGGVEWNEETVKRPDVCKWIKAEADNQCPPHLVGHIQGMRLPLSQPLRGTLALVTAYRKAGSKFTKLRAERIDGDPPVLTERANWGTVVSAPAAPPAPPAPPPGYAAPAGAPGWPATAPQGVPPGQGWATPPAPPPPAAPPGYAPPAPPPGYAPPAAPPAPPGTPPAAPPGWPTTPGGTPGGFPPAQ